jgi:hypothetical protein
MVRTQLAAAVLTLGSFMAHAATPPDRLTLTPLTFALPGSTAQPNIAATKSGFVLSWQQKRPDGCNTLFTATLDANATRGKALPVASGCNWFVNWIDFPSVTVAQNGDWLSYWLEKSGFSHPASVSQADSYAYDIHVTRSRDAGKSWSTAIIPHTDATPTEHGFVSMAPLTNDRVLMIWLDGRNTLSAGANAGHSHDGHDTHGEGPMSLRSVEIDRAGKLHHAHEIDARVCSCCSTDLAAIAGGAVALYRDRTAGEIRDIAAARYQNGRWQAPASVHADGWKIAGCPTNGPAVAVVAGRTVAIWPTLISDQLEVRAKYVGSSAAAVVIERGENVLGRPDAAAFGAGVLVSWLGQSAGTAAGESALKLRLLDADLQQVNHVSVTALRGGRSIGVPKLAVYKNTGVLVWTEATAGNNSQIKGVRIRAR